MELLFRAIAEDEPGEKWQDLFTEQWPAYRQWFLSEGIEERPTYLEGLKKLKRYMPELLPTYERLCELSDGLDLEARFLNLYRPPAYITGCSQVVWTGDEPVLIRNYDYSPALCEGVILLSRWHGRAVLSMVDCLWGALDGVNDAGLAVSLTIDTIAQVHVTHDQVTGAVAGQQSRVCGIRGISEVIRIALLDCHLVVLDFTISSQPAESD